MLGNLRRYSCLERLADGQKITVRAARPDDGPRIRRAFSHLDSRTRYMRFLSQKDKLTDKEIARLTGADFENSIVLLATIGEGPEEEVIGGVSCFVLNPRAAQRSAEMGFTVDQDFQSRGVGAALMRHVARIALAKGLCSLQAEVLCNNASMLGVFRRSGLPMTTRPDGNVLHVTLSLAETSLARSA